MIWSSILISKSSHWTDNLCLDPIIMSSVLATFKLSLLAFSQQLRLFNSGVPTVPSSHPGQVHFSTGQVMFPSHLPDGKGPCKSSANLRLNYQLLSRNGARAPVPQTHSWICGLAIGIVNFNQYKLCLPESSRLHKLSFSE